MMRWCVTGPIGSGKSTLTGFLAGLGAAVLDGDRLGHEILARPSTLAAVSAAFGPAVLDGDRVDRGKLGAIVFSDPAAMTRLNRLTHGPLAALFRSRLDALENGGQHVLAVLEAAVYFLLPDRPSMDLVICVNAPEALRRERLVERGGLSTAEATRRIRSQDAMAPLWSAADVHLVNDAGPAQMEAAAHALWDRHVGGARSHQPDSAGNRPGEELK